MNLMQFNVRSADADILKNATVFINDNNLKPKWVEHPAKFTEFHVKRGKKDLLVVIGESWTYGETVKDIATGIQRFNLETQLKYTLGPRMALMLGTDLYQYAVPGNCNFYMFTELERILEYVSTLGYETIYVSIQMTEPARENPILDELEKHNHGLMNIISVDTKMTFKDWLIEYDNIFFDQYENMLSKYKNVKAMLWKNFCKVNTPNVNRSFKILDKTWIEYTSKVLSTPIVSPTFYSIGWIDTITKTPMYDHIKFDKSKLLEEFDLIEKSNGFIKTNALHNNHPNEFGHILWAQYLLRKAGWVDGI